MDSDTHSGKERDDGESDGVHRLLDILTQEVSLVTRAANKREWLVRKGRDEMDPNGREVFTDDDGNLTTGKDDQDVAKLSMPAGVKTAVLAGAESAMGRLEKLQAGLDASTESDSVSEVPPAVAAEFKSIATALSGLLSKYPSPKSKDGDVNKGDDPPHADPSTADASSADDKGDEDGDVNKVVWELPSGYKAKLSAACKAAKSLIEGVISKVKAAEEADGDGDPMPPEIGKAIEDAAAKLDLEVPKAESDKEECRATETDESIDKEDAKKASPFSMIKDAASTLDAVMKKLQPGQPIDEDSYQRLERLRALVSSLNSKTPQGGDEGGDEGKDSDETAKAGVEKAGARMAKKRRQKFQTAIKALIELFKDVMPSSELGKMPHLQIHKGEDDLKVARSELKKAQDELAIAKAEVRALRERPVDSNVTPVEGVNMDRTHTNEGDDASSWPWDMNEE